MTHACGYEHPSQMKMTDIDISGGDNNNVDTLENTYGYKKVEVPFESMEALFVHSREFSPASTTGDGVKITRTLSYSTEQLSFEVDSSVIRIDPALRSSGLGL